MDFQTNAQVFRGPDYSEWTCHLFTHAGCGISYRPLKGKVPNAWHRFWQRVILGFRWTKTD